MKNVHKFVKIICNDLGIKKPQIKIDDSNFMSNTQLASYDPYSKNITIKKKYENKLDLYFSISHELRHKYQIDNNLFDFKNYKKVNELSNAEYNLQIEELDANAYAYMIMVSAFGVEAQFKGLEQNVINKIKERANEIIKQSKH